jgi:vacuolar protein sorting-associated protein 13A/C
MQAIFNAARQAAANQAGQIQESASKMLFDVVVKTPIIVFPRTMVPGRESDLITAYLGEIYAQNQFATVKGSKHGATANKLTTGMRNIRLTSKFSYEDGSSEELEMIDKVDLGFKLKYIEHEAGLDRPDMEIEGNMSPINLKISQTQLKFLLELSQSIPAALSTNPDADEDETLEELPSSRQEQAKQASNIGSKEERDNNTAKTDQNPEITAGEDAWTKLDLVFNAEKIGLELILAKEDEPVKNLETASLSKFAINETGVKLKMMSDGAIDSELLIHSFTILDSRTQENNKYRKIMSLINDDVKQQFMAQVSISGGPEKHVIAQASIDSPRIIFAVDYLAALSNFASGAFASDPPIEDSVLEDNEEDSDDNESSLQASDTPRSNTEGDTASGGMTVSFRINVEDAQVILIANPTISNSEAIVLGTKKVLLAKQHSSTLQVTKVGMFLCRMDRFETSRLRILDDFSLILSMENRSQGKNSQLTSIHIDIEPLVLRLSLRDILLAQQIINKAAEINSGSQGKIDDAEPKKIKDSNLSGQQSSKSKSVSKRPATSASKRTGHTRAKSSVEEPKQRRSVVLKREEMNAEVQGIRVILIGDLHELPLIDWSIKKFTVDVRDWSGAMTGDTNFDTYINVFNFSKSAWEPLIEPWQLGFHVSKEQTPDSLAVEIYSHKNMDLTITSATIALASKTSQFLSTEEDVLSKPRGTDAPYRIRNYTGFDLNVWAATREEDQGSAAKLEDGEEVPWRFEDPTTMRENLSPEGKAGIVGVKLEGSGFESIERIAVNREGETLYNLRPRQEKIQHRLLVEVKLGADNVKYITFRSPLLVENNTQIPIELGIFSPEDGHLLKIEKIPPGEGRPAPVGAAFKHSLVVRPDPGFGYAWSNERLFWKDLLKRPVRTIKCRGEANDESPPFFFQMSANYNKNDPMTNVYPFMRIRLSSPVEIQNLLPYDFKYQIYDQTTKKDWTNFLRKGGVSPVHVVELSHALLLSVDMQDTPYKTSDYFFINTSAKDDYKRDTTLQVRDAQGMQLSLKMHYFNVPDSGGAFKVSIYSPYVILNKTGMEMMIQSKAAFSAARSAAGQGVRTESDRDSRKAKPYMFSYPNDDRKNRALLKIGDSGWSKPQSFDAIGSTFDAVLPGSNPKHEMHVGVSVAEGEGKYKLTKVVTVAPRFIIKNKLPEGIQVREPSSSEIMLIEPGNLLPLKYIRASAEKQLCLCFPGVNNSWSFPFNIDNVGTVYVKLAKHRERQKLIKVEVILEEATLFLHLSYETKSWPFEMRNESSMEFMFYQVNPNVLEDDEDRTSGWRPIKYKLPKRSIMPYAWDYPASKNKEIVLVSNGKERRVKLAEIGEQLPLNVPAEPGSRYVRTVDLSVVAQGPNQTLVIKDHNPSKSIYQQKSASSSGRVDTGFEAKNIDASVTFKAQLRLAGIGISIINRHMKELLYFTMRELEIKYTESSVYQTLRAQIKWIQIDNMLYGGIFPIILYPTVVPKTGKEMESHPILQASITRVKDDSFGVLYIKYASLLLQELTVEIDEDFIFSMLDFVKVPGATWSEEVEGKLCDEDLGVPEPKREHQSQDVYFEVLHLHPMQINLSFVRTERINAEDTLTTSNPLMFVVNIMTMSIGNVNDAPLRFNALLLENARVSVSALIDNIRSHYSQEALRQVHVVLGSADFLGNPVGLFNNISSGVADIFYEPYQGLVMTDRPQDLGIGIAKGASSFVKRTVFGFSDSMAKFTGSMSKGLAAATLDKEFQDQRRMSRNRNRPKHALYGITAGGNAFANSMASGIGGLARHPLEGAEKEGVAGFVKGVGKGFLGLPTKAAIGAFDLASSKLLLSLKCNL